MVWNKIKMNHYLYKSLNKLLRGAIYIIVKLPTFFTKKININFEINLFFLIGVIFGIVFLYFLVKLLIFLGPWEMFGE